MIIARKAVVFRVKNEWHEKFFTRRSQVKFLAWVLLIKIQQFSMMSLKPKIMIIAAVMKSLSYNFVKEIIPLRLCYFSYFFLLLLSSVAQEFAAILPSGLNIEISLSFIISVFHCCGHFFVFKKKKRLGYGINNMKSVYGMKYIFH